MQKVIPGLYQINNGANIFLLETDPGELAVLDSGMPGSTRAILKAAAELGYDAAAIRHILITHAD
ncbi:MAG: MBL fold metallo-hydrolase, partial [Anaerolineae bacterium]|nr:MBL fold metallo-hydrolase [Anaerolineae bacterium]